MTKITKTTTIGQALKANKNAQAVLLGFGMNCSGCPMSHTETLEEAAVSHGVDLELMLTKLNEAPKGGGGCGSGGGHCGRCGK